jgi:hypothetical protein
MITEITTLFASTRAAYNIAKGIGSLHVQVERDKAISELLQILLSAQDDSLSMREKYQSLIEEKNNIAKQLMEFKSWDKIVSQYSLTKLQFGSIVYSPNQSHPNPNPLHWLCANCFNSKIKSILQPKEMGHPRPLYCPVCNSVIHIGLKDHDHYFNEAQNN